MRVLLRSRTTKLYLKDEDEWTPDRVSARNFVTGGQAILFASQEQFANMEVVLVFEDPRWDISTPLQSAPRALGPDLS